MNDTTLMTFEYDNEILIARYISNKPITKEIAQQIVQQRLEFTRGKAVRMMLVFPNLTNMDKGGRDYLSSSDGKEGVLASAMVVNTIIGRVIINFFLRLNNKDHHLIPHKVFNNEADALDWIRNLNLN